MTRPSRIMILDDSHAERCILREAFVDAQWNAEIEESSTKAHALETLRQKSVEGNPPDLILMDYMLGGERCVSTLMSIRSLPGYARQPIIIFSSAMPTQPMQAECYSLGVLKILKKSHNYSAAVDLAKALRRMFLATGDLSSGGTWISNGDEVLANG